MIDKEYNKYFVICDVCGEASDEQFDTFAEAKEYAASNGYKTTRVDRDWFDICSTCQEKE